MSIPFIHRYPTQNEEVLLKLCMSTFRDGSGQERDKYGATRPGWRDLERIIAESLKGSCPENKCIFDVIIESYTKKKVYHGVSVKSKKLSQSAFNRLDDNGRLYMEIANSPAKFWQALNNVGIKEEDFRRNNNPELVGKTVINLIKKWHDDYKHQVESPAKRKILDLDESIYLCISYYLPNGSPPVYQIHSFPLEYPENIIWEYKGDRCLRGFDPEEPEEAIIDWYALSGGQLKYYPMARKAIFKTKKFEILSTKVMNISEKAFMYWPEKWIDAGGDHMLPLTELSRELEKYKLIFKDNSIIVGIINDAIQSIMEANK